MSTQTETKDTTDYKAAIQTRLKACPNEILMELIKRTRQEMATKPEARLLMFYCLDEYENRNGEQAVDSLLEQQLRRESLRK